MPPVTATQRLVNGALVSARRFEPCPPCHLKETTMTAPLGRSRHRTGCRCCAYAETNSVLRQVEERAWRRELATFFDEHADDITEDDVSPEAAQIAADAIRRAWDAQHPDN